ncbi:MAG: hypothetical protein ACRDN0_17035 [Trebonia sp.]
MLSAAACLLPLSGAQNALAAPRLAAGARIPSVEVCGRGAAVIKPGRFILTCADDGEIASHLHWTSWSATRATATGTVTWRTGADLSRSKSWSKAAAGLTLSDPVSGPGGKALFTKLAVRVTGRTPSRFHRDQAFGETPLPPLPVSSAPAIQAVRAAADTAASGTLGYARVEGFWEDAGGPLKEAETAAAITGAESSFYPGIIQQGVDYCLSGGDGAGWGLWQISCGNEVPAYGTAFQLLDPWNNAEAAVYLYDSRGFEPWTVYETGAYETFMRNGVAADTALADPGQYEQDGSTPPDTPASPHPGSTAGSALNPYMATFEDNDVYLYGYRDSTTAKGSDRGTALGMDAGTSPSTAGLSDGKTYITAFQDNDHELYLTDSDGRNTPTTLGLGPGTSPAVAGLTAKDKWEAAFQDSDNDLAFRSSGGAVTATRLEMDPGTSPAITASRGGWIAAFHDRDHDLSVESSAGTAVTTTLGMKPGTSPAITALANGGFAIAFQSGTGALDTYVTDGTSASDMAGGKGSTTRYSMNPSSSPAIASHGDSWEAAFETNRQTLDTCLSNGTGHETTLRMDAGTDPSIAVEPNGSYVIAFDDNDHDLYLTASTGKNTGTTLRMRPGTSPAVSTPHK